MKTVTFVQPALPDYRSDFYEKLSANFDLALYSNEIDFLGVKSTCCRENTVFGGGFLKVGPLFWHRKLPILTIIRRSRLVVVCGNPKVINYMILLVLCRFYSLPTIWWGHGISPRSNKFRLFVRSAFMRLASAVMLYVDDEKAHFTQRNMFAAGNGIKRVKPLDYARSVSSRSTKVLRLVFIGRLTEKSNLLFLLSTLANYDLKFVDLTIIGDGPCISSFRAYCEKTKISSQIRWAGPLYSESEIATILDENDFFIYPGAVGLSLIHAFNYGLPAIVHGDGSRQMPEYAAFKHGLNGLSFDFSSESSLNRVLHQAISMSNDQWIRMSNCALSTIREKYNTDIMVKNFSEAIQAIS